VVQHVKDGREHVHVVWSRIDLENNRAIPDSHNYRKHEEVARELEREFGHARVQGAHVEREGKERPARTPSREEMQQAGRTGLDPKAIKAEVTALWEKADSGKAFANALEASGYALARGDKRDFILVDQAGETHSLARRIDGAKAAEIRAKMADVDQGKLPDAQAAKAMQAQRAQAAQEAAKTAQKDQEAPKAKEAVKAPENAPQEPPRALDGPKPPQPAQKLPETPEEAMIRRWQGMSSNKLWSEYERVRPEAVRSEVEGHKDVREADAALQKAQKAVEQGPEKVRHAEKAWKDQADGITAWRKQHGARAWLHDRGIMRHKPLIEAEKRLVNLAATLKVAKADMAAAPANLAAATKVFSKVLGLVTKAVELARGVPGPKMLAEMKKIIDGKYQENRERERAARQQSREERDLGRGIER
jgi:hypothetical protein